jgi:hypothetical protein
MARGAGSDEVAPFLPNVEFSATSTSIEPGGSTILSWRVTRADEATLWSSGALPETPEPLDWPAIAEMGKRISLADTVEATPAVSTAFYLVARGPHGLHGSRILVEVTAERPEPPTAPETWQPLSAFLPSMEAAPHVARLDHLAAPEFATAQGFALPPFPPVVWHASPTVTVSPSPEALFTDESATLTWTTTNATCIGMGQNVITTKLAADPTKVSGTKFAGSSYGVAGWPPCALPVNGTTKVTGPPYGASHRIIGITAKSAAGADATAGWWVDVLPGPQFTGAASPARVTAIRTAIKTVDRLLRYGCIYHHTGLDASVAAFKDGHLNRTEVWSRLLRELQNIKLVTFHCQDVADAAWGAGSWGDYSNTVNLEWSPSHTPYLAYVILHELVHKCGFHGELLKHYSVQSIEQQAHAVSGACLP